MNTITINEKEYSFRFSFVAIRKFCALTGMKFQDLGEIGPDHILEILYAGLYGGARRDKVQFTLTLEDLENWLDENFSRMDEIMSMVSYDMQGEKSNEGK